MAASTSLSSWVKRIFSNARMSSFQIGLSPSSREICRIVLMRVSRGALAKARSR